MIEPAAVTIVISRQTLILKADKKVFTYAVSSSKNGVGSEKNTEKTPLGKHYIRAKIGADLPLNAVLTGRRWTGELYSAALSAQFPQRDWILTRILWLCGMELGKNRLGTVDSMRRYIYIHGTPDSEPMGVPKSHGCIRMRNEDVIDLFRRVSIGTPVNIEV